MEDQQRELLKQIKLARSEAKNQSQEFFQSLDKKIDSRTNTMEFTFNEELTQKYEKLLDRIA